MRAPEATSASVNVADRWHRQRYPPWKHSTDTPVGCSRHLGLGSGASPVSPFWSSAEPKVCVTKVEILGPYDEDSTAMNATGRDSALKIHCRSSPRQCYTLLPTPEGLEWGSCSRGRLESIATTSGRLQLTRINQDSANKSLVKTLK